MNIYDPDKKRRVVYSAMSVEVKKNDCTYNINDQLMGVEIQHVVVVLAQRTNNRY